MFVCLILFYLYDLLEQQGRHSTIQNNQLSNHLSPSFASFIALKCPNLYRYPCRRDDCELKNWIPMGLSLVLLLLPPPSLPVLLV